MWISGMLWSRLHFSLIVLLCISTSCLKRFRRRWNATGWEMIKPDNAIRNSQYEFPLVFPVVLHLICSPYLNLPHFFPFCLYYFTFDSDFVALLFFPLSSLSKDEYKDAIQRSETRKIEQYLEQRSAAERLAEQISQEFRIIFSVHYHEHSLWYFCISFLSMIFDFYQRGYWCCSIIFMYHYYYFNFFSILHPLDDKNRMAEERRNRLFQKSRVRQEINSSLSNQSSLTEKRKQARRQYGV